MSTSYAPAHQRSPSLHQRSPSLSQPPEFRSVTVDQGLTIQPPDRSATPSKLHKSPHSASQAFHPDTQSSFGVACLWLRGRMGGRGPRRWAALLGALALLWCYANWDDGGPVPGLASLAPRARLLSPMGVMLGPGAGRDDDESDPRDAVPRVDRVAFEKLRLLEIHLGLEDEEAKLARVEEAEDAEVGAMAAAWRSGNQRVVDSRLAAKRPHQGHHRPSLRFPNKYRDPEGIPLVAQIPDIPPPNKAMPSTLTHLDAEILDGEYCPERNGAPCAFLVPAWVPDQESKGQQHLYQLGLLALTLNRTLVLPNVNKARLGGCYASPFELYFSPTALSSLGIPTIPWRRFIEWTERRTPPATAQVVTMVNAKGVYAHGAIEIDSAADPLLVPGHANRKLCLSPGRARLDFASHSPLSIFPPSNAHKGEAARMSFGESVVNTLSSVEVARKSSRATTDLSGAEGTGSLPNVLAVNYEVKFPFMAPKLVGALAPMVQAPGVYSGLEYAQPWVEVAEAMAAQMSPFAAIQWKVELAPLSHLSACVNSLIKQVQLVKQQYPEIKAVYLATDFPVDHHINTQHGKSRSITFDKAIKKDHLVAFKRLIAAVAKQVPGVELTSFANEEAKLDMPEVRDLVRRGVVASMNAAGDLRAPPESPTIADLEAGLVGPIDKMVAKMAEVFM